MKSKHKEKPFLIKRVCYVDWEQSIPGKNAGNPFFSSGVLSRYTVLRESRLADLVDNSKLLKNIDCIVTRITPDLAHSRDEIWEQRIRMGDTAAWEEEYRASLECLHDIKVSRDIPIIAHSGASYTALSHFMRMGVIDDFIRRTDDPGSQQEQMLRSIDAAKNKYERINDVRTMNTDDFQDGHIKSAATIWTNGGLNKASARKISRLTKDGGGQITLCANSLSARADDEKQLLKLNASFGQQVQLLSSSDDRETFSVIRKIREQLKQRYCFRW